MKKLLIFVLCLILLIVGLYGVSYLMNDHYARRVMKRITDLPLPEETEYLDSLFYAGNLAGSSNSMEYFGAMLIKSNLPFEQLEEYYEAHGCYISSRADVQVNVFNYKSFDAEYGQDMPDYVVYDYGEGHPFFSEFDLRGH